MRIIEIVRLASILSPIGGILIFFGSRMLSNRLANILVTLMIFSLMTDVVSYGLAINGVRTVEIINCFFIIQAMILGWFYKHASVNGPTDFLIAVVATMAMVLNGIFLQPFSQLQNNSFIISMLLGLLISFRHFLTLSKEPVIFVHKFGPYWVACGVFFYFSISFVVLSLSNYVASNYPDALKWTWMFHNAANILKNIFFAIGLWWFPRRDRLLGN